MICAQYVNEFECLLTLNNEYNMKLLSLLLIFAISVYLWYISKRIDSEQSYYHFLLSMITAYMPIIFIMTSPFFVLLLSHNISFDMFVLILVSIYLVGFALGFGLLSLYAKKKITDMLSKASKDNMAERRKYGQNG